MVCRFLINFLNRQLFLALFPIYSLFSLFLHPCPSLHHLHPLNYQLHHHLLIHLVEYSQRTIYRIFQEHLQNETQQSSLLSCPFLFRSSSTPSCAADSIVYTKFDTRIPVHRNRSSSFEDCAFARNSKKDIISMAETNAPMGITLMIRFTFSQ